MNEQQILAAVIHNRDAFTAIAGYVGRDDLSEQGWLIWGGVCAYYDADPLCQSVSVEILTNNITRGLASDKHKEMFKSLIFGIAGISESGPNVVANLLATKRDVAGKRLASSILSGVGDNGVLLLKYSDLLTATTLGEETEEDARIGLSVETLVSTGFSADNLVEVYPLNLNERLEGGVKPGHHLLLFARPEMGKTAMTIEMMAGFATQGLTTLYIGNEDPIDDINMRVINRLTGMTKLEVLTSPKKADQLARSSGYENIILKAMSPGTPREIQALLEKYKPHVLVLDQLRNLNMSQESRVLALEQAATKAREWAKRYSCVVVSVTQAGDSASGKAILDMGDVDFSNTGIPSQADVMIGLGASDNDMAMGRIVISLPKNKVSGRHEHFSCEIHPALSKITPLG